LERPPAFERAWTPYPYLPPLRDAICAFKYRGKYALAEPLARLMINVLPSHLIADFIIPVPLHPTRLRSREYNQSLLLADQIGRHLRIAVWPTSLVRVLHTDPQTTLSRHDRLRNLRKAFSILNPERLVGKRILLVDDVYTTGTTLHECAKELMNSGANSVVALTLARTVDRDLVPDRILAEQGERTLPVLGF
jgi:ComF family protein